MRRLVLVSLFAGATVALGLLFLTVPNLELVTMTCFLAGYFLGPRDGVIAAATGEGLFSLLNPMGTAAPPMLMAQIVSVSLAALAGSLTSIKPLGYFRRRTETESLDRSENSSEPASKKSRWITNWRRWRVPAYFAFWGILLTAIFDVLTTLSFTLFAGQTLHIFVTSLVFGLPFYLMHIGSNTLIFALVIPVTISRLDTWFDRVLGSRA